MDTLLALVQYLKSSFVHYFIHQMQSVEFLRCQNSPIIIHQNHMGRRLLSAPMRFSFLTGLHSRKSHRTAPRRCQSGVAGGKYCGNSPTTHRCFCRRAPSPIGGLRSRLPEIRHMPETVK